MNNKKGQLDKILTTLPVLIFIILIMAAFIFISFSLQVIKNPQKLNIAGLQISEDTNVLLFPIELKEGGLSRRLLVFEGIIRYHRGELKRAVLEAGLQGLLKDDGTCLAIAKGIFEHPAGRTGGPADDDFFIQKKDDTVNSLHIGARSLAFGSSVYDGKRSSLSILVPTTEGEQKLFIEYYYGRCL